MGVDGSIVVVVVVGGRGLDWEFCSFRKEFSAVWNLMLNLVGCFQ